MRCTLLRRRQRMPQIDASVSSVCALTPEEAKKSTAGRKPFDAILMFRMLILQSLYNLSDEQIEYRVCEMMTAARSPRRAQMISMAWHGGLKGPTRPANQ